VIVGGGIRCFWCRRFATEGAERRGHWLCPECLESVDKHDPDAKMMADGFVRPHSCPGCQCGWVLESHP
jgi:hypothetical protein